MSDGANNRLTALQSQLTANSTTNPYGKELNTATEPPLLMMEERAKTDFPVRQMTYFLDGGKPQTLKKEGMMTQLERDPAFDNKDYYDLTKDELRENSIRKIVRLVPYATSESEADFSMRLNLAGVADMGTLTRVGVHYGLFCNAIRSGGTSEQLSFWIGQGALSARGIYGCFAMTEMGHGSNVAGLETTATYDEKKQEFVINTPHIAATKWWIGGAAHTATHTVCFARLIVGGKDYGVKNFVVPLRDPKSYGLLPGISIGDIGKKMGRDAIDNGWIQFSHVRIPRSYMLMKYTKVSEDGTVTEPPLAQLTYGALIAGRVSMAVDSAWVGKRFLTIALRYACVRRQFSSSSSGKETKLIDYTFHQRRLIPLLAQVFALQFASDEMSKKFRELRHALDTLSSDSSKGKQAAILTSLKDVFGTSAGLKAFSTWDAAETIDQCRQACGGQGYSGYNGFGQGYADWVVQCTWEGDNNILSLSTGRFLIQNYLALQKGGQVSDALKYLENVDSLKNQKLDSEAEVDTEDNIRQAWDAVRATVISKAAELYSQELKKTDNPDEAFEGVSQQRFLAARVHTRGYVVTKFWDRIAIAPASVRPVLTDLAKLYSLWLIEKDAALFLQSGFLQSSHIDFVTARVTELCNKLRPQLIGLTDSFNLSDFFINSPIGKWDGNIYHNYFEKVKTSNRPPPTAPYTKDLILPFINRPAAPDLPEPEEEE